MTGSYDQGNVVRVSSQDTSADPPVLGFTSTVLGVPNTLVDPPTVLFVCTRPNLPNGTPQAPIRSTWTVSAGDPSLIIVHRSTGLFTADIDTSGAPGTYTYRFYSSPGAPYQASAQSSFHVNADAVV